MPDVKRSKKVSAAKKAHQEGNKKRADEINSRRASFLKIRDEPAMEYIVYFLQHLADLHSTVAKDGIGYRDKGRDISGNAEQEMVYLDKDRRISELDKAAGLEEGVAFIQRQLKEENLRPVKAKTVVAD